MNRFGLALVLLFVFATIGFASVVHVRGPGWSGEEGSGPTVPRSDGPVAGSLVLPVQGVSPAKLADSWADPRSGGTRAHHAIDIMAPAGTPVLAASDGYVEKIYESNRGGHTIYERSADGGTIFYYAHLDHYATGLAEGQAVKAGQQIAAVGSTGDADVSAPHLHFEVHRMAAGEGWWQGKEANPYPLLTGGSWVKVVERVSVAPDANQANAAVVENGN